MDGFLVRLILIPLSLFLGLYLYRRQKLGKTLFAYQSKTYLWISILWFVLAAVRLAMYFTSLNPREAETAAEQTAVSLAFATILFLRGRFRLGPQGFMHGPTSFAWSELTRWNWENQQLLLTTSRKRLLGGNPVKTAVPYSEALNTLLQQFGPARS